MGKKQKQPQEDDQPDEPVKVVDAYAHIVGPSKDYVVKILRRVDKAPRVRATFQKLIDAVKRQKAEDEKEGKETDTLDKLIAQLEDFSSSKDPRKVADFNNYENKFTFTP